MTVPKPVSAKWEPERTRLPKHNPARWTFRAIMRLVMHIMLLLYTRVTVRGLKNFPRRGPALMVTNHLGDADFIVELAYLGTFPDPVAAIELFYEYHPMLGPLIDLYGVIWVHRGQPDRRALRAALDGLAAGRIIAIAPEGRESLTGALEEGVPGAAWLAMKANVPIVPVTVTGTQTEPINAARQGKGRAPVTLTIGKPFRLPPFENRDQALEEGTRLIMRALAAQLPPEYRGVYKDSL